MPKLDVIICLGKSINSDGTLDWILEKRVELAYELARKRNIPLILTGFKSYRRDEEIDITEASAMYNYLRTNHNIKNMKIILEEKGESTIHQLCIIKKNLLVPNKWYLVGIVTDKIHLRRAKITAKWIFGDEFRVYGFESKVNLVGIFRKTYESSEKEKYNLTVDSILKKYKKGDDKAILHFDQRVRKTSKKHIGSGGNPDNLHKITNG